MTDDTTRGEFMLGKIDSTQLFENPAEIISHAVSHHNVSYTPYYRDNRNKTPRQVTKKCLKRKRKERENGQGI